MKMRSRFNEFVQDEMNSPLSILGALTVLLEESGGASKRIAEAVDRAVHVEIDRMKSEKVH